jgi:NAD(P)H-dependent flavin oxidoreductase YrpB (nitropropane dioxygenase family)
MDLLDRLGLDHPILQAGMAGGIVTPELAAAVSRAGALGTLGLVSPERLRADLRRARELDGGRAPAVGLLRRGPAPGRAVARRSSGAGDGASVLGRQRLAVPLFSPASLRPGMDEALAEVTPLYAGEGVRWMERVIPAAEAVALLAG